jgi:hypothetical protein
MLKAQYLGSEGKRIGKITGYKIIRLFQVWLNET